MLCRDGFGHYTSPRGLIFRGRTAHTCTIHLSNLIKDLKPIQPAVAFMERAVCAGDRAEMTGKPRHLQSQHRHLYLLWSFTIVFRDSNSLLDLPLLSGLGPKRLLLAETRTLHLAKTTDCIASSPITQSYTCWGLWCDTRAVQPLRAKPARHGRMAHNYNSFAITEPENVSWSPGKAVPGHAAVLHGAAPAQSSRSEACSANARTQP
jgi:hypothetical protein